MPDDAEWEWRGKPKRRVFPVIRVQPGHIEFDNPGMLPDGLWGIDVTLVLPTYEEAVAEADRLNALNGSKGYRYYALASRYYPEGRASGGPAPDAALRQERHPALGESGSRASTPQLGRGR